MIIDANNPPHLTPVMVKVEAFEECSYQQAYYNAMSCTWHDVATDEVVYHVVGWL